jgi:hypothetical protein
VENVLMQPSQNYSTTTTTTKRKTPKRNKHQQARNKPLPTVTPSNHQAIKQW